MNDLLCCETTAIENRAYIDPNLLNQRVLNNLLKTEERYMSASFVNVQKEVTPHMRKIVAEWMMEVCDEQNRQDEVFPLAMNFLDRFLMVCCISKRQLQLLGTVCMLLASKLREPKPLLAETLVFYTDHSITKSDLWSWEVLVLSKLKWDIAAVTPQDFLSHILRRLPILSIGIPYELVNSHSKTLIALCAREYNFSGYPASLIAAATVISALCGLGWINKSGESVEDLLNRLHNITSIEQDYLKTCTKQIESMVSQTTDDNIDETLPRPNEFTPPPTNEKFIDHESAGTPTDVRDVHF
ncbi:PREDICTED: G1/S-specific cyclin-D2-like [Nicrophorus vespilloides]|uniref:G1/S-specific cyclin-D2-like n=1 Tax=Nicrophorus vespilloides TaxID=110193 RepID=A0ABM1MDR3_NICVS|nr:PREDICTED: G1/S-specific cyclin-D2-like [Nicrophorus vespilloides]